MKYLAVTALLVCSRLGRSGTTVALRVHAALGGGSRCPPVPDSIALWAGPDLRTRLMRHRVRHPLVIFWLLLYGSLMAPPALLAQYGGMPLGRLNWGGIWLWLLPIGWWMRAERASLERYVRPVVLTAFAYQAILACRWIPNPTDLIRLPPSSLVWARDSLFPLPVRYIFPHFYLSAGDRYRFKPDLGDGGRSTGGGCGAPKDGVVFFPSGSAALP